MSRDSTIVIFGASGDLSQRKLIPALFNLYRKGRLLERFTVLGLATRPWDDQAFRIAMRAALVEHADYAFQETEWEQFALACITVRVISATRPLTNFSRAL
jgi:glucose-6-phosphate 1-dehydrogenase